MICNVEFIRVRRNGSSLAAVWIYPSGDVVVSPDLSSFYYNEETTREIFSPARTFSHISPHLTGPDLHPLDILNQPLRFRHRYQVLYSSGNYKQYDLSDYVCESSIFQLLIDHLERKSIF